MTGLPPHSCGGCESRWYGANMCHCSSKNCHRTFGGITAFDKHRVRGECINPARSPLFTESRPGVWSSDRPGGWEKGGAHSAAVDE